jgi:hypothetical protein
MKAGTFTEESGVRVWHRGCHLGRARRVLDTRFGGLKRIHSRGFSRLIATSACDETCAAGCTASLVPAYIYIYSLRLGPCQVVLLLSRKPLVRNEEIKHGIARQAHGRPQGRARIECNGTP